MLNFGKWEMTKIKYHFKALCACVRACVRACVCACMHACVRVVEFHLLLIQ